MSAHVYLYTNRNNNSTGLSDLPLILRSQRTFDICLEIVYTSIASTANLFLNTGSNPAPFLLNGFKYAKMHINFYNYVKGQWVCRQFTIIDLWLQKFFHSSTTMDFTQEVIERMCEGLSGERAALIRAVIEENMDLRINLDKATKLHSKTVEVAICFCFFLFFSFLFLILTACSLQFLWCEDKTQSGILFVAKCLENGSLQVKGHKDLSPSFCCKSLLAPRNCSV